MIKSEKLNDMVTMYEGDCLAAMKSMASDSVDAVVTDPPYGLKFMGKKWDYDVPSVELWQEVLRVSKPGGHLLSFAGTRTQHRMATRIEDAGFEIRDIVSWMYGSGMPKSMSVSKAIDKAYGANRECTKPGKIQRDGYGEDWDTGSSSSRPRYDEPATDIARDWQGWATAIKPSFEPITLARKPLIGTVAENVIKYGTGALNIDGCRVPTGGGDNPSIARRKGAINHLSDRPAAETEAEGRMASRQSPETYRADRFGETLGRFPSNTIHDGSDEVMEAFASFGTSKSSSGTVYPGVAAFGMMNDDGWQPSRRTYVAVADVGSPARFFYCAKASKKEKGEGNHPTVKPLSLMQYLVRLVTRRGGIVLDPYAGTGTTGLAAMAEGCRCILIEREPEYCEIIRRRVREANVPKQRDLFSGLDQDGLGDPDPVD